MFHMLGLLDGFKIALNKFYLKLMICGQLYGEPGEGTVILLVLIVFAGFSAWTQAWECCCSYWNPQSGRYLCMVFTMKGPVGANPLPSVPFHTIKGKWGFSICSHLLWTLFYCVLTPPFKLHIDLWALLLKPTICVTSVHRSACGAHSGSRMGNLNLK